MKKLHVTFIGPNIVSQKGDFFGTGIPYFPLVISYTAAAVREKGYAIKLIDAFGENPTQVIEEGDKVIQGLTSNQILQRIPHETNLFCLSAERLVAHGAIIAIIRDLKRHPMFSKIPIAILENTQAVTAYALEQVQDDFFKEGVSFVLTGEPELRVVQLLEVLEQKKDAKEEEKEQFLFKIDGLFFKDKKGVLQKNPKKSFIENPDVLPFPAWDLLPLENYWKLGYAHAPLTTKKYLPLLTSRGCPYPCTFCVVPATNDQKWRPRSAKNVVEEMEFFTKKYGVNEYHLEDLNPTIKKERIKEISQLIIEKKLDVIWKIASGTKAETLDEETIQWMAKAGCKYISISPESGSSRIMKLIRKPFPYDRALELVREMHKNDITTQACFILGYPGEEKEDIHKTNEYIHQIVKAGIDEIAVYILAPTPGSIIFQEYLKKGELPEVTQLTFSPKWRKDYNKYTKERVKSYALFVLWRCLYYPRSVLTTLFHFIRKRFHTKMEMTVYRVLKVWKLYTFPKRIGKV